MRIRNRLVLSLVALSACATVQQERTSGTPTLISTSFSTVSQTLSSYTVDVTVAVMNPRAETLQFTRAAYTLTVDGKIVREGVYPLDVGVAPTASGQFDVQVAVEYAPKLTDFETGKESFDVLVKGTAVGRYGEQKVELPFERAGVVRSPRLPTVTLGEPAASRQRIDDVNASFSLVVQNENPFDLKVTRLDYVLDVEGRELSSGMLASHTTLPASSSNRYEIDQELNEDTLPGIADIMRQKNALDYSLRGSLRVGDLEIPFDLKSQIRFAAER